MPLSGNGTEDEGETLRERDRELCGKAESVSGIFFRKKRKDRGAEEWLNSS